ncbi:methylated-DNA/protein-cysteine methyltransferase [Methanocaldococcus infernus ME]|uniref:Methylated-DNA--protein-cysteine methyltransferase n=1 Tax=Methanocaldococcus infernus (strain DSM 11812 / JCM 15783 / ME) TaxID=573063 RepID=D5VTL6_METIM|nr:methylated-DNA/protein-cysteine methyltransferase [Methanocaldococcus infernus ME]
MIKINNYYIGLIFKDGYLVENTIPLKCKLEGYSEDGEEIAKIILKLYLAELSDKEARKRIRFKLLTSDFTKRVLKEVCKIPFGETITYGELAEKLKSSPRAVGRALNKNPLPLIIPCHRVIAKDGVGGYKYGVEEKIKILERERNALLRANKI